MSQFFQILISLFMSFLTLLGLYTPEKEVKMTQTVVSNISAMENIRQVEGGCTDGRYIYQILIDPTYTGDRYAETPSKIIKIDSGNWVTVKTSEQFDNLNHANDMTYNAAEGTLLICNNVPNYTVISVIDTDSLQLVKTITVSRPLYAIVYVGDVDSDCYYCGISNTYDLVKYDKEFNELGTMSLINNGYTRQSIDTDGSYLYLPYYYNDTETKEKHNYIYRYTFNGETAGKLELPTTSYESENVFFINGVMYVAYNILGTGNGGVICKVENPKFE